MSVYRLPEGYQRQHPAPFDDWQSQDGRVWQPDVYPHAAKTATALGLHRIIDLGCGSGSKLVAMAGDFDVIGVDVAATVTRCAAEHRTGTWIAHDLDADVDLPALPADALVVCSDVIEHLWHPHRLLSRLIGSGWPVVLSTPERTLTHGHHMGPPPNPAHAQEWTLAELCGWLTDEGATITHSGTTRSHDGTTDEQTCLVVFR